MIAIKGLHYDYLMFWLLNEPSKEVVERIADAGKEAALWKSGGATQERQKQNRTSHPETKLSGLFLLHS